MTATETPVKTTLRIPGNWAHPGELLERLPDGVHLTPEALLLPDGTEVEVALMPPDDAFASVFESSCRKPASDAEMVIVNSYTVNVGLIGPGGSKEAALKTMQAGAAIVQAGGGGVFIDNSALSHGGSDWIEMTEDGGPDALGFAFVAIVRGKEVWTLGMHVIGLPDLVMQCSDLEADDATIIDVIRYLCRGEKPVGNGHLLADLNGPRFQAMATTYQRFEAGSPMYNPFGRLNLVSVKEIAEGN